MASSKSGQVRSRIIGTLKEGIPKRPTVSRKKQEADQLKRKRLSRLNSRKASDRNATKSNGLPKRIK